MSSPNSHEEGVFTFVRTAKQTGGSAMKTPLKKPNKAAIAMMPPALATAIMHRHNTAQMRAPGAIRLSGPVVSDMAFGTVRPNTDAAFSIGTM